MSRRGSSVTSPGNTLFNYFTKSPKVANAATKRKSPEPEENTSHNTSKFSDSENEEEIPIVSRRKRIKIASDDESDENKSDVENVPNNSKKRLENSFKFEPRTPIRASPSSAKKIKTESPSNKSFNDKDTSILDTTKSLEQDDSGSWTHCRLDWLKPENVRDSQKRRPNHPDYDPRTLYVPDDYLLKQTPGHRQWWEMKALHYDCVLFFKVGKFYELYHMDAVIGVNDLGFSYMKGDFAHSGFPESAYARMASSLVQKGHRVARVEQTETPEMLQERVKKSKATKEKVVRREICQITCKGTEVLSLQENGPTDAAASYLLAVCEQDIDKGCSKYGICFIDTSIGLFHLGQFEDDRHSSRLLTALAHYPPALVLHERGVITERTKKVLRMSCQSARREALTPQKQFWSAHQTLKTMAEKYYKQDSGLVWPAGLKPMLNEGDTLGLTPAENSDLAIRALGACLWYLTESLLDIQIMEMAFFKTYQPPNTNFKVMPKNDAITKMPNNMVLDATTIANLKITGNDMSLFSRLDNCATAMGKRLLYQWVCSPSCNVSVIKERQDGITYFLDNPSLVQDVRAIFNNLPDMERLLTKIHSLGNLNRSKNHPDSRAIFYEEKIYSKRKVLDFISLLNGFQSTLNIVDKFSACESSLIKRIARLEPQGSYPDYSDVLEFFKTAFDHQLAEKDGIILPEKGVDKEYDGILEEIAEIESELEEYRTSQEKYFNCKVSYFGSDKKRFQLEIPELKTKKADSDYQLEGTRKGYKRYSTPETKDLLLRMLKAEEQKRNVLKDLSRRIFEKFSQSHLLWQKSILYISTLDVLMALSEYTRLQSGDVCVPEISLPKSGKKPYIVIKDGRHPCMPCSVDFISNDTCLNENDVASLMLLTGPNMGGKSTLMRQLGLLIIMAQIGCHVPASECSLTIVDRIFTRLGAHDDIMTGQSTFLVELSETAAILKHTTINSLVLLDELGRGTSTYDGTAIAASVVDELSSRGCRTMFSTHYHTLVEDFKNNTNISLAHMACMVETDESESDNSENVTQETVTFLYKLSPGACPKSYGFNAARLAGISKEITHRAHQIAIRMEKEANLVALFKRIYSKSVNSNENLKTLIAACKNLTL